MQQCEALELLDISKHFNPVIAVDRVNLRIPAGQMVGIIGRSGAGKSTLLRIINRLSDPSSGRIQFGSTVVTSLKGRHLREWRSKCAMIFQQFNLVGRLDVMTNVLVGRVGYRSTIPTLLKRFTMDEKIQAVAALEKLDMVDQALQRADTLSGGQQQRVAIARSLVQNPNLILADEPISSLDPHNAGKVMEALKRINMESGITVLCNLHHLETACRYCDRLIGMAVGKIVFDGTPHSLTDQAISQIYGTTDDDERQAAVAPPPSHSVIPTPPLTPDLFPATSN